MADIKEELRTWQKKKIDRLKPPVWDPENQSYNDWRFLVGMWSTAWKKAKLAKGDRGYMLFQTLKDINRVRTGLPIQNRLFCIKKTGLMNVKKQEFQRKTDTFCLGFIT